MKTLLTLFSKGRSKLQAEIDRATSLDAVVKLVQNQLDDLKTMYIGDLSVAQARLALFFLDTLRQSVAILTAANETKSHPDPQQIIGGAMLPNSILKLLQVLICVGVLGLLFSLTRSAPLAWMDILLMSLLIGLEVAIQLNKVNPENSPASLQLIEAPQLSVQVDSKVLLDNIADALNTIDRAVAQAEEVKKPFNSTSEIEEIPELLNFLQMLIGTSSFENPEMTLELTKLLPQILMEQGIRVQVYRPNDEHSSRGYFDFEPPIDQSARDYVTLAPALLKGEQVLRRGRVIEPAYTGAK